MMSSIPTAVNPLGKMLIASGSCTADVSASKSRNDSMS